MFRLGHVFYSKTVSQLTLNLGFNNRAAHVMTAIGAGHMRRCCRTALGAGLELLSGQSVVRPTLARAGIGMFAFGDGHD